jgi:signal peptidase I
LTETDSSRQPEPANQAPTTSAPAATAPRAASAPATPVPAGNRAVRSLTAIAEALLLTLVIYFVTQTFVVQPFHVFQESMLPTFHPGDYVLVDKLTPRFDGYARGEVIVFNPVTRATCSGPVVSDQGSEPFIKRVIGEPNDVILLKDGAVWINGHGIDEPYAHGQQTDPLSDASSWVVPTDRLFVMGDNRGDSTDSRAFGPICQVDVIGRAWLRYWPFEKFGTIETPQYPGVAQASGAITVLGPAPSKDPKKARRSFRLVNFDFVVDQQVKSGVGQ